MQDILIRLYDSFMGSNEYVAPAYLISFVLIAGAVYLWRRETIGFRAWLFPRAIWTHKSTRLDLTLFTLGQLMQFFGVLTRFVATPLMATWIAGLIPFAPLGGATLSPVTLALLFWVISEFATYWNHRAHHQISAIWPLHAVHHSAAVMTPFTAYRQHPVAILTSVSFHSVITGMLLGLLVGVLDPNASIAKIAGANAFIVAANLTVSNFHHTHIWISFGPWIERIFISPAQHQVHHSKDPAHFNKNYGQILAVWDWMFGTLYVTQAKENVTFGLDGKADASLMTHRLSLVLWDPLRRVLVHAKGGS